MRRFCRLTRVIEMLDIGSFDLAGAPLRRADGMRDEDRHGAPTPEQSPIMMIDRLRVFTGQNLGYDPNAGEHEKVIATREKWFKDSEECSTRRPLSVPENVLF